MEFSTLLLVHVFFGIVWGGAVILVGFFIVPSVMEAGPAGGAVMAGMMKRRFSVLMSVSAILVMLSGLRLYSIRFSAAFLGTPEGIALTVGALAGIGAFFTGLIVQRPAGERLGALGAEIAAGGGKPTPEQAQEMQVLRGKLEKGGRATAWQVLIASLLMAAHRLAAML